MSISSRKQVSQLLEEWSSGDKAALDRLMPLVYEELRLWQDITCEESALAIRSKLPLWSTRHICGWLITGT